MSLIKAFQSHSHGKVYQDKLLDDGHVIRTEPAPLGIIRASHTGYDKHYWEDVTARPNAFNLAGAESATFRDKRVLRRWRDAAKAMPCKSWDLNPRLAMAIIRHGVAKFDHRTCEISLTRIGRDLLEPVDA